MTVATSVRRLKKTRVVGAAPLARGFTPAPRPSLNGYSYSDAHDANRWQQKFALGELLLPPILGFVHRRARKTQNRLQTENCCLFSHFKVERTNYVILEKLKNSTHPGISGVSGERLAYAIAFWRYAWMQD
jgi:hypothetical protein